MAVSPSISSRLANTTTRTISGTATRCSLIIVAEVFRVTSKSSILELYSHLSTKPEVELALTPTCP